MAFHILTCTGQVVVRKSIWAISKEDMKKTETQTKLAQVDLDIKQKIGDSITNSNIDPGILPLFPEPPDDLFTAHDEETATPLNPEEDHPELDDYTPDSYGQYLTTEVLLPHGGELH